MFKKRVVLALVSIFGLVLLLFFTFLQFSNIQRITSFSQINLEQIPAKSLVCYDVDETLIQPVDGFFVKQYTEQGESFIQNLRMNNPEVDNWDELYSIMMLQAQRPLIEKSVLGAIKHLQQRGVFVIAFTFMNVGKLGLIDRLEVWRYNHLYSLGFKGSFCDKEYIFSYDNKHPLFYKGVLFSDLSDKGAVLGLFLDAMKMHPPLIVMIDDNLNFLYSVEKECKRRKIPFQGYHYCGYKTVEWNDQVVKKQAEYLLTHKQWLSDDEVNQLIYK